MIRRIYGDTRGECTKQPVAMRFLRKLIVVLLVIAAVLIGVGFLLPDRVHLERSISVHVSPERLFPLVSDLRKFKSWNPWYAKDPHMHYRFEGPASGIGSTMRWRSTRPDVGSGSQTIVESRPPEYLRTRLDFGARGQASGSFVIQAVPEGSIVTWSLDTEFGRDLIGRYFGLVMEYFVGGDYEAGLASLKKIAEGAP